MTHTGARIVLTIAGSVVAASTLFGGTASASDVPGGRAPLECHAGFCRDPFGNVFGRPWFLPLPTGSAGSS